MSLDDAMGKEDELSDITILLSEAADDVEGAYDCVFSDIVFHANMDSLIENLEQALKLAKAVRT